MLKKADPDALDRAVALVAGHTGYSYEAVAKLLGGRKSTALGLLRQAVDEGLLYEGTGEVPARKAGAVRSVRGLFVDRPGVKAQPLLFSDGSQLRALRESAGVSQASLGAQLGRGVSRFLVNHWEAGRQSMPAWVWQELPEALEAAHHPASPLRRRAVARRRAVLKVVQDDPGVSRVQLRERTRMAQQTVGRVLDQLFMSGAAHEASHVYTGARGGQRFGVGVFPGKARPRPASPTAQALYVASQRAGWSQARIARGLGISPAAWSYRMSHAPDQELPGAIGPKASEVLQAMYEDAQRFEQELLAAVAKKPTTRERLTRRTYGRSTMVEAVIDRLLSMNRLHMGHARDVNAAGVARYVKVLLPGPALATELLMSAADFTERRQLSGLSRPQFAKLYGVTKTQVGYWERGDQPIPAGRTDELRALFDELGTAPARHQDVIRHTDDELEEIALQLLTTTPGQSRRALTAQMPGDVLRRHATVQRLIDSGHLVERQERRHRSDGHAFTARFLYVREQLQLDVLAALPRSIQELNELGLAGNADLRRLIEDLVDDGRAHEGLLPPAAANAAGVSQRRRGYLPGPGSVPGRSRQVGDATSGVPE